MRLTNVNEIDVENLSNRIGQGNNSFKIIDVREFHEMAHGVINGAIPIPLATLPVRLSEFDPAEELILVCRSGARSAQACYFLNNQGFTNTYNLVGGMMAWIRRGLKTSVPVPAF